MGGLYSCSHHHDHVKLCYAQILVLTNNFHWTLFSTILSKWTDSGWQLKADSFHPFGGFQGLYFKKRHFSRWNHFGGGGSSSGASAENGGDLPNELVHSRQLGWIVPLKFEKYFPYFTKYHPSYKKTWGCAGLLNIWIHQTKTDQYTRCWLWGRSWLGWKEQGPDLKNLERLMNRTETNWKCQFLWARPRKNYISCNLSIRRKNYTSMKM